MYKKARQLFFETAMPWKTVLIFAAAAGVYTGLVNIIPIFKNTSVSDIAVTMECWVLFAIIIIMNCEKPLEAALKCFVFFLISQPLVFLTESPVLGIEVFNYYPKWFVYTLLTFPGAYLAWYVKKGNVLSAIILSAATVIVAICGVINWDNMLSSFPRHLLATIFCAFLAICLPIVLFEDKKPRAITIGITVLAAAAILFVRT